LEGALRATDEGKPDMSKLSKEEIEKRGRRMQQEALKSVAKTEQLNIRMDESNIVRLYDLARIKRKPVGTMVREWIVERLDCEEQAPSSADESIVVEFTGQMRWRSSEREGVF